jgi:alpha-amylase
MSQLYQNGVLFQFFHWYLYKDDLRCEGKSLWTFLRDEANHLKDIGITAVWIPPPCKAEGGENDNGYSVYDRYDLGDLPQTCEYNSISKSGTVRTKYGTKAELISAIQTLHNSQAPIQVYADVIINHQSGGGEDDYWLAIRTEKDDRTKERRGSGYEEGEIDVKGYTKFTYPARNGQYSKFQWYARHFNGVDSSVSIRQNGNTFNEPNEKYIYRFLYNEQNYNPPVKAWDNYVSTEKGNYDYEMGVDLDFDREDVKQEIKDWGTWLTNHIDIDGVRIDTIKHVNAQFTREWLGHIRYFSHKYNNFAIGEYYTEDRSISEEFKLLIKRINDMGEFPQQCSFFDFQLRNKFRDASYNKGYYNLAELNRNTLQREYPMLAVTFVENHDRQHGRNPDSHVREWIKPLAYAYILLRKDGYPCVFFADYYGSANNGYHVGQPEGRYYLDLLLKLRKEYALGEERYYETYDGPNATAVGWMRMGFVDGAKGAMAVVINTSNSVKPVRMNTGRFNRKFYHCATIKFVESNSSFLIAQGAYDLYGDKSIDIWTDQFGFADFVADGETVTIWLEA